MYEFSVIEGGEVTAMIPILTVAYMTMNLNHSFECFLMNPST